MNLDSVLRGKFSIISKSGVRYVGFLLGIEGEQKTLSFEKVISYGSEGRIGNGRDIPPSNNVFDFIIFKAEEIAHLKLIEPPPTPPQNEIFTDPAIVQTGPKSTPGDNSSLQNNTRPNYNMEQDRAPEKATVDSFPQPSQESFPEVQPSFDNNGSDRFADNKNAPKDFQGGHRNNNKNMPRQNQRNGPRNYRSKPGLTIPDSDFDFQSFNAQFNKEDLKKEFSSSEFGLNSNDGSQDTKGFYDKKTSFFDNISCDSKNKAEGQNSNSFGFQRKNNYETFGINSKYNRNNNGGYRGSRGRGNNNSRYQGQGSNRNNPNQSQMNSTGGNNDRSFIPGSTEQ